MDAKVSCMMITLCSFQLLALRPGDIADTLAISLHALRLHPFPVNPITSRPQVASSRPPSGLVSRGGSRTPGIGAPREDRQYAVLVEKLSCSALSLTEALNSPTRMRSAPSGEFQPTLLLLGQHPAFEWNRAATQAKEMLVDSFLS